MEGLPCSPALAVENINENNLRQTQHELRRLESRDSLLWASAIAVLLLLTFAVYFVTLDRLPGEPYSELQRQITTAIRGSFALVLLFSLFALYKQITISRLRRHLASQMNLLVALRTRAEVFHQLAILDPLTGLYNRRFATEHLPIEIARARRHHYQLTTLMLDLRGLKRVNEDYGHAAGDAMLREFASALRRVIRSSDLAVRLGGDEFLVVLPECGASDVPLVLARLSTAEIELQGKQIPVTFAAGWAVYQADETPEQMLERADRALREDKRTGSARQQAREAQVEIRHAEKMEVMGRLTSSVAHDFNNLLTIIKGFAEIVAGTVESASVREQVQEIHKAAERAAALTGQLLSFARKQVIDPKAINLNQVVSGAEMMLSRLLGDRIQLQKRYAPALDNVMADAGQIEQMLMNVAANARDAMPVGGTVTIETANYDIDESFARAHPGARPGGYVLLAVRDTGLGMDSETRKRIFEPFFTTKDPAKGTGLGLATVYGAVKQNGGYVWVDSEPAKGTTVSIYLPRISVGAVAPVLAPAPSTGRGATKVLVVETLDLLRNFMCDYLQTNGYAVMQTVSAAEAVQMAADHSGSIDLMISSAALPGVSALELAECIRAQHPEMKTMFVAGCADDAQVCRESLDHAGGAWLAAPFTAEQFGGALRALLKAEPAAITA